MAQYVFIESRDAYESVDSVHFLELVRGVRDARHDVTLLLIQNGVIAAREGAQRSGRYQELAEAGVRVLADSFSLRERGVDRLMSGVRAVEIDQVVASLLATGARVLWH